MSRSGSAWKVIAQSDLVGMRCGCRRPLSLIRLWDIHARQLIALVECQRCRATWEWGAP
jgi:hypothetical protein